MHRSSVDGGLGGRVRRVHLFAILHAVHHRTDIVEADLFAKPIVDWFELPVIGVRVDGGFDGGDLAGRDPRPSVRDALVQQIVLQVEISFPLHFVL